ncbi:MAG: LemA family protein, partial [Solirubrobacterales bacterium]
MTIALLVALGLLALVALAFILLRNGMIAMRNQCDEAWSGIDVQLKRRHDLVPNLVETVKGYATHERRVFEATAKARAEAMSAGDISGRQEAEARLSGALVELRAVAENYPELRATENFQRLQADLAAIEDQLQAARRTYNADVQAYNTRIQILPSSIVARLGGFESRAFFELETTAEREPARVSLSVQGPRVNRGVRVC